MHGHQRGILLGGALVLILLVVAAVWTRSTGSVIGYPGRVNQETLDMPADVRAAWELQRNMVEAMREYYPDDASLEITRAVYELRLGNYAVARRSIESALDKAPADTGAWIILGDVAAKMEDWQASERAYLAALDLYSDATVYPKLEALYRGGLKEKRYDQIEALYKQAIDNEGQDSFYLTRLATWYEENERWEDALSHWEVVKQLNPTDPNVNEDIARVRAHITE